MEASSAASIIARLENGGSDYQGFYRQTSDFLLPFADYVALDSHDPSQSSTTTVKKKTVRKKKVAKENDVDEKHLRSLAKEFLSFLSKMLKLLPSILRKRDKGSSVRGQEGEEKREEDVLELFCVYKLVLDCFQCILPCLRANSYTMHLQRSSLVVCLESCGKYAEAEGVALSLLESLASVVSSAAPAAKRSGRGKTGKVGKRYLPVLDGGTRDNDNELATLIVEIAVSIMGCVYKSKTKDGASYVRIIAIAEELQPWLRVLGKEIHEKYLAAFLNTLYRCSMLLAAESMWFDANLVHSFCMMTLHEYSKSLLRDQLPKISRKICSSFHLQWENRHILIFDMLRFCTESILCKCKAYLASNADDFFDFVSYCAENFTNSSADVSRSAFELLSEAASHYLEVVPTVTSMLNLYAVGLCFNSFDNPDGHFGHSEDGSSFPHSVNSKKWHPCVPSSTNFLSCNLPISKYCNGVVSGALLKEQTDDFCTYQVETMSSTCEYKHGNPSLFSCFNALEFACKFLADFVTVAWKEVVSQGKAFCCSEDITYIYDIFHQFGHLYHKMVRSIEVPVSQRGILVESHGSLFHAAIAALRISLATNWSEENVVTWIDNLMSSEWTKPKELKFLVSSLYSIGVSLHDTNREDKASVALHLCCKAVWARVKLLCQLSVDDSKTVSNIDLSEDSVKGVITDACAKSASIFYVLSQCHDMNISNLMEHCLLSWAAVGHALDSPTNPKDLVKAWAKIIHKDYTEATTIDDFPFLYPLLSSHVSTMPKKIVGIILEQEFLAYEEVFVCNSNIWPLLRQKVADFLLQDIYVTKEYFLQRATMLVLKGKALRAAGTDGLHSCIQCLCEAVFLLNGSCNPTQEKMVNHLLAITYCLRAQCAHEVKQDVKVILQDIRMALDIWLKVVPQDSFSVGDHFDLVTGNTLQLLYSVADLLYLKGVLEIQTEIHKLSVVFWKVKCVPLESCIAMLWRDRRLNHVHCPLLVDVNTIHSISQHFGVDANSVSLWVSSLKDTPAAALGLLQKLILSDFIMPQISCRNQERSFGYKVTIEEIETIASSLLSCAHMTSHSAFAAAYLYYDLSERLYLGGRFHEALKYAKEALRLRKKILQMKFVYSSKQQVVDDKACGRTTVYLDAVGSVVTEVWPLTNKCWNLEQPYLNPWNILKCYLESMLQVGFIHENIGEGTDAEYYLQSGKKISIFQNLKFSEALFSSHLAKVYCRKQQYDLANNELQGAKSILKDNNMAISCKFCKLDLEAAIDMRIGDVSRSLSMGISQIPSMDSLSNALHLYTAAFEKLTGTNLGVTQILTSDGGNVNDGNRAAIRSSACITCKCSLHESHNEPKRMNSTTHLDVGNEGVSTTKVVHKRSKNLSRTLRSRQAPSSELQTKTTSHDCSSSCEISDVSNDEGHSFGISNCWTCFLIRIVEAGSMQDLIFQKWECHRRRLLLEVLSRIGGCTDVRSGIHNVHKWFLLSMSLLFLRDPCNQTQSASHCSTFLKLIEEDRSGDTFAIERAVILYDMSLFFVNNCLSENSGARCCSLSIVQLPTVISWLLRAFILTREYPLLFQKIAQLLATLFLLSTLGGNYAIHKYCRNTLSVRHWAVYFHQASIGTILHHQHLSAVNDKNCDPMNSPFTRTTERATDSSTVFRMVPEKIVQFEECVEEFFTSFPGCTVVCVSFLEGDYINILGEALLLTSFVPAWLLLSRLDSSSQPIAILLPVDLVSEASSESQDDASSCSTLFFEGQKPVRTWPCPWGHTVIDTVAPQFKSMLEENYLSLSNITPDANDTQKNRLKWWSQRKRLNDRLGRFLRSIEDLWLGPWRCLFLGERSYPECFDKMLIRLLDLNFQDKFEVNQTLLKLIIGGSSSLADIEACSHQLFLYGGYFGRGKCSGEGRFRAFSTVGDPGEQKMKQEAHQLMLEAFNMLLEESVDREPIILVLDADVQMLPWENLPVLRKQEVYRMPSVGSIPVILNRRSCANKKMKLFPFIDTLSTYYLLNPGGDLSGTQKEFEEWFINQNWELNAVSGNPSQVSKLRGWVSTSCFSSNRKSVYLYTVLDGKTLLTSTVCKKQGKAGNAPTPEELSAALQSHDLYIYFGHGSGAQYIPGQKVSKLSKCAASLLMGCSSGSLTLKGCYAPEGPPLSYLFADSPAVIANLWEVSDKDIDRFGKSMVSSWLQEGSHGECSCSSSIVQELECMKIDLENHTKTLRNRRVLPRGKKKEADRQSHCPSCTSRIRITSFMSKARDACKLPVLIGASPVCYGVPTIIRNSNEFG